MTQSHGVLVVPGGRLAYEVTGPADGALVVAVHGMGTNRHAFRLLAPALAAEGYRVARLDLRGHGDSSVDWPDYDAERVGDDVLALVRELGGPAILIGSSIASAAVTFAAAAAPGEVSGVIVIGAPVHQHRPNLVMRMAQAVVLRSPLLWGVYYATLFPAGKPADFAADRARLLRQLRQRGRMAAVRGVIAPTAVHWTERAGTVGCPVRVIMGTKDPDFADPGAEAHAAAAAFRAASSVDVVLVDGSGHYPFLDAPAVTIDAVRTFRARTVVA